MQVEFWGQSNESGVGNGGFKFSKTQLNGILTTTFREISVCCRVRSEIMQVEFWCQSNECGARKGGLTFFFFLIIFTSYETHYWL